MVNCAWGAAALRTDNAVAGRPAPGKGEPQVSAQENLIRGYFEYGLYEPGYRTIQADWKVIPARAILESAEILRRQSEVLTSIRLMNLYLRRTEAEPVREELEMLYPQAFGDKIEELAAAEELPPALFFALVREA